MCNKFVLNFKPFCLAFVVVLHWIETCYLQYNFVSLFLDVNRAATLFRKTLWKKYLISAFIKRDCSDCAFVAFNLI